MKIGDKVWQFEENRRVYEEPRVGFGNIIWAEHFAPVEVIGETSRSWLIGRGSYVHCKVPKKNPFKDRKIYTDQMKEDAVWHHDNRGEVVRIIERMSPEDLRKLAAQIGYEPPNTTD